MAEDPAGSRKHGFLFERAAEEVALSTDVPLDKGMTFIDGFYGTPIHRLIARCARTSVRIVLNVRNLDRHAHWLLKGEMVLPLHVIPRPPCHLHTGQRDKVTRYEAKTCNRFTVARFTHDALKRARISSPRITGSAAPH